MDSTDDLGAGIDAFLATPGAGICEVVCGTEQFWAPKLGARQLPDGSMVSPSLEDMSPFLSAEELAASRFVDEAGADGTDL